MDEARWSAGFQEGIDYPKVVPPLSNLGRNSGADMGVRVGIGQAKLKCFELFNQHK